MQAVIKDTGKNNIIQMHPSVRVEKNVSINIKGNDHHIEVEEGSVLRNLHIFVEGQGTRLIIGKNCDLRGSIYLRQKASTIHIGAKTTFVGANLFALEGKTITIGEDCMFSTGINARTSDEHPVYDTLTNERINPAGDIIIGEHVWLGEGVTVGKKVTIAAGVIVGAKSVVTKSLTTPEATYVGTPAKLIRANTRWERKLV